MTAHIECNKEKIAKTVIMPGDPLRAKFIAENYLENYELVNSIRGMLAYTGYYNKKKVTIMASGMGMGSIGIYSYELFNFYDVDNIIRVGSAGSYKEEIKLYDIILVDKSYSDSSFAHVQNKTTDNIIGSSIKLNNEIIEQAKIKNINLNIGTIYSSDVFYKEFEDYKFLTEKYDCLGTEMESFALFHNAKVLGKKATCLLTVSNNFVTNEETTARERQNSFTKMIELALSII